MAMLSATYGQPLGTCTVNARKCQARSAEDLEIAKSMRRGSQFQSRPRENARSRSEKGAPSEFRNRCATENLLYLEP